MPVSLWAVLGVVLLLISLPFVLLAAYSAFAYPAGAGAAFLIVAASQWLWERWGTTPHDESASAQT